MVVLVVILPQLPGEDASGTQGTPGRRAAEDGGSALINDVADILRCQVAGSKLGQS